MCRTARNGGTVSGMADTTWYLVVEVDRAGDPFLDGHQLFGPDRAAADETAAVLNAEWGCVRYVVCVVTPAARVD